MSISFGLALYFVIWWTTLFAVLPIGVRSQEEEGAIVPGTPESAPAAPRLLRVVVINTLVALVVFAALWAVFHFKIVDIDAMLSRGMNLDQK